MAFAVDASYTRATEEHLEALKVRGVELFIQCLWTGAEQPDPRISNLRCALNVGLPVAGYGSFLESATSNDHGRRHMEWVRSGVPDDIWRALKFVAVDIELPSIGISAIAGAVNWLREDGKLPIIYTSYNAWVNLVKPSNSPVLSNMGVPLWNAYWDQDPDIDFPKLRYGGWRDDQVWIEQWSGGVDMELLHVDRNTFVKEKVLPTMPSEEYVTKAEGKVAGLFLKGAAAAIAGDKTMLTPADKAAIKWLVSQ